MSSAGAKIMIVDDEPDILLVTKMAVEMCGFSTETFRDPFQALTSSGRAPPPRLFARAD